MMEKPVYQEVLETILKSLVTKPEDIKIERKIDEMGVLLSIKVNPHDVGLVIGKKGNMIKALRVLIRAVGLKNHARVNLKVEEPKSSKMSVDEVIEDLKS